VSFWDDKPVLLIASLVALMVSVGCVWAMAATDSALAVGPAIVASVAGTAFLLRVIGRQMEDDDTADAP
jgi:hypothetical protein